MGAALPCRARRAASLGGPQVAGGHPPRLSPWRARLGEGPRQGGSVRTDGCARDQSPGLGGPLRHTGSLEPARACLARLARPLSGHARSARYLAGGALPRAPLRPALGEARLSRPRAPGAHAGRAAAGPVATAPSGALLSAASAAPGGPLGPRGRAPHRAKVPESLDILARSGRSSGLDATLHTSRRGTGSFEAGERLRSSRLAAALGLLALVFCSVRSTAALDVGEWIPGLKLTPFLAERMTYETNVFQVPSGSQGDAVFKTIPGFLSLIHI